VTTGLQLGFAFCLLLGFIFSPESPRFLAKKERWEECRKNLASLRGLPVEHQDIDVEMDEVRIAKEKDDARGEASYLEVFSTKDRILWRTMIGICVQIGQQGEWAIPRASRIAHRTSRPDSSLQIPTLTLAVSGINFFFSYGVQFAQTAGLDDTYVFSIILASVNVIMSFPGILAVDRAGRRPVLLIGAAVMFLGQIVTGAVSKAHPDSKQAGNVLITFTCIFVAAFASSWGPVAWVVCGETFPIRLSSICVTLGTAANW
jgi:SP family sugar:H+ symporter-like MFS transporter